MKMQGGPALVWGLVSLCFSLVMGLLVVGQLQTASLTGGGQLFNSTDYCMGGIKNATGCPTGTLTKIPPEYTAAGTVLTNLSTGSTWIGILVVVGFAALVYGFVQIFRGAGGE